MFNDEMERMIKPSQSDFYSPVMLAKKKDGSVRFCVDYRLLNKVTIKDGYPLPNIRVMFDRLGGAKYFSLFDCVTGYWQIRLTPSAAKFSAFVTPEGLYEWTAMPFGLGNAPATFQRAMDVMLSGLSGDMAFVYIDDVLVFSKTPEEHANNVAIVLDRFIAANLKLKLKKCIFVAKSIKFLGHIISQDGIAMDPEKTDVVRNWPELTNVLEVQQFIGFVNYYRDFVPSFAAKLGPLYEIVKKTKKQVHFSTLWTKTAKTAFNMLKEEMAVGVVLKIPDFNDRFVLTCDACVTGVAAVVSQLVNGVDRPIAFASKIMDAGYQSRYINVSTSEAECLGIIFGMEKFRMYLYGVEFDLYTDHKALIWLATIDNPTGKLGRWLSSIQEYRFIIRHVAGKKIPHVDALSRQNRNAQNNSSAVAVAAVSAVSVDNIDITDMTSAEFFEAMKTMPHTSKSGLNWKRLRKNSSEGQIQSPRKVQIRSVTEVPSASKPFFATAVNVNTVSLLHPYRPLPIAAVKDVNNEHLAMCKVLTCAIREGLADKNGKNSRGNNFKKENSNSVHSLLSQSVVDVGVCNVSRPSTTACVAAVTVVPLKKVVRGVVVRKPLVNAQAGTVVRSVPARGTGTNRVVSGAQPTIPVNSGVVLPVLAKPVVVNPKVAKVDTDVKIPVRAEGEEEDVQSKTFAEDMAALLAMLESQEVEAMVRDQGADPFFGAVYRYRKDRMKDPITAKVSMECSRSERKLIEKGIDTYFISDDGRLWSLPYKLADGTSGIPKRARLCIPNCRVAEVLEVSHRLGHLSSTKMYFTLRVRFFWRFMVTDIKNFCDACVVCQKRVGKQGKYGKLQPMLARVRNMLVSCDHSGPYPTTALGNKYILVFTDHFSRFVELVAVKDLTTESTARAFIEFYVQRHGIPFYLLSDRGAAFTAGLFRLVCTILGVHKLFTTAYHPQCDGMTERFNRTMNTMLAKLIDVQCNDWDSLKLASIQSAYNNSINPSTQLSPQYLKCGFECPLPADLIFVLSSAKSELSDSIAKQLTFAADAYRIAQAVANENSETASSDMADYYNKSRTDPSTVFKVGGKVWFYGNPIKSLTPKLVSPWIGPFRIEEIVSENLYRVSDVRTGQAIDQVISSRRLKPYVAEFRPLQAPDFEIEDAEESDFFLNNETLGTVEVVSALQDLANRRTAFALGKKVTTESLKKVTRYRGKAPATVSKKVAVLAAKGVLPIIVPSVGNNPNTGNHLFQPIFQEHTNNVVPREPSLGKDAVVPVSASNELPVKSDIIAVGVPKSQVASIAVPIGLASVPLDMVVANRVAMPVMASAAVDANAHSDLRRGDGVTNPPITNQASTPILSHPNPIHIPSNSSLNLVAQSESNAFDGHSPVMSQVVRVNRSCILPVMGGTLPLDEKKVMVSKSAAVAVSAPVGSIRAASTRVRKLAARWR